MAQYEEDEFDALAREAGPVGVHRAPRPWVMGLIAPLVVFLLAGLLAFIIVWWNWNQDITSSDDATATATATTSSTSSASPSASATPSASAAASASPSASPSASETAEPVIEYDTAVAVRNGSGIAGLAGTQQTLLEGEGFTSVEANNINLSLIPDGQNTVVYADEALADTAAEIADVLGIDSVLQQSTPGGTAIEVLLASDPAA
ncbi:LytR C-terminal domain-containing protein [Demequina sp. NBRC 110054]|uniref:LytR C-terminal domain-containing protein n=1 Tax=Demequina sp. NBRC 110054 TaxID=1570343 RepID=UPI000A06492D|nr:LytR C-terminal domain-containing protein [Demequina sp. NBRC 110054]